ncbi:hypothetical protein Tco_0821151 [Tanacetum coccineum]|uniref:DNA-directed RNA polymerase n=1 Tax=Tanacetum coccineum TaxID=301880 RepID=A0ABQ5AEL3_9ASTR
MILNIWTESKEKYGINVALGIHHWGPKHQQFYRARHNQVSTHKVYSRIKILSIIRISIDREFGYGYLKEIVVRRANQKDYIFNEADFKRLYLNDIEDMYLLIVLNKRVEDVQLGVESYQTKLNITRPQVKCDGLEAKETYTIMYEPRGVAYFNKNNDQYLMSMDELHKFIDGTLKIVRDILNTRLHNFVLGYNVGMPKRT